MQVPNVEIQDPITFPVAGQHFPTDLSRKILSYMDAVSLINASTLNKTFKELCQVDDPTTWKQFLPSYVISECDESKTDYKTGFKKAYKRAYMSLRERMSLIASSRSPLYTYFYYPEKMDRLQKLMDSERGYLYEH